MKRSKNDILDDVLINKKSIRNKTNKARKMVFWKIVRAHFKFNWQFSKTLLLERFIDIKVRWLMFWGKRFKSLNMELIGNLYEPYNRAEEKLIHMYDRNKKTEDNNNTAFVRNEDETLLDIEENNVYGWKERMESEEDQPSAAEVWGIKPLEVSCSDSDKPWQKEGSGFNLVELALLMEKEKKNSKYNRNMN